MHIRLIRLSLVAVAVCWVCLPPHHAAAQWAGAKHERLLKSIEQTFGEPKGGKRLDPVSRVWADKKNKRVIVDGFIALREGQLEMLACIVDTKEHESVVAVYSRAFLVHAGLLAVGAEKGAPVKWRPEYQPPTGSEIRVIALWKDEDGTRHAIDTRKWVREVGTGGAELQSNYVFAGSGMYKDPSTDEEIYLADDQGELICVANFESATLDVPLRSLKSNELLSFKAYTENIPPSETPVRLVLEVIDNEKNTGEASEDTAGQPDEPTGDTTASQPGFSLAAYERLLDSPSDVKAGATEPNDE